MAKALPAQRFNLARLRLHRAIAFVARHRVGVGHTHQAERFDEVLEQQVLNAPTLTAAFELLSDEQKLALRDHLENPSVNVIDYPSKNSWSKDNLMVLDLLEAGEILLFGVAPPVPNLGTKARRTRR